MKLKLACCILGTLLLISGCGSKKLNKTVIIDTIEIQETDNNGKEVNLLDISSEYQKIFINYRKTKSDELLKELNPLTICAFYFLAEEQEDYETQYALLDTSASQLTPSKEEYLKEAASVDKKGKQEFLEKLRKQVIHVETVMLKNGQCIIVLNFKNEQKYDFRLTRIEKDIWKISYLPMQ